ncbi:hypothetical protein KIN20_006117 [Parelaphostrongylus tenuis]|uniref:PSP proline-rich domain-containing protein n=1 Tax=Parelaphostrongylus tenuis TaxID=148309 RepID=A0AAD5M355_PARTN|nr:hypothetical protein KIN20_006117 [Parelaphostrongylus tenuis]
MSDIQCTRFDSDEEEGRCTPSPVLKKRRLSPLRILNADVMKGNETDYGDFVIDRTESINLDNEEIAMLESSSSIEKCSKWKEKILSGLLTSRLDESGDQTPKTSTARKKIGCFNCDGDHHVNECSQPKDSRRIRLRIAVMRNKKNLSRYHDEMESSEKKFQPGRISDQLREALGIGQHDIPEYIYRMRKLGFIDGYPPAYLKRAIEEDESSKTLNFYMSDGNVSSSDVLERPDSPPPIINAEKMIYYLGFNQSYRDLRDREDFRIPPFSEFVAFHQETLNKAHAKKLEERRRRRDRDVKAAMRRRTNGLEEDEVVILELPPPPPPPSFINNSDDDDIVILDSESSKTSSSSTASSEAPKGSSIGVMLGTPVLTRRRINGKEAEVEEAKPSLDNFRKGIVPFEAHEEPTPHKGFLKRIMSKIKKATC